MYHSYLRDSCGPNTLGPGCQPPKAPWSTRPKQESVLPLLAGEGWVQGCVCFILAHTSIQSDMQGRFEPATSGSAVSCSVAVSIPVGSFRALLVICAQGLGRLNRSRKNSRWNCDINVDHVYVWENVSAFREQHECYLSLSPVYPWGGQPLNLILAAVRVPPGKLHIQYFHEFYIFLYPELRIVWEAMIDKVPCNGF